MCVSHTPPPGPSPSPAPPHKSRATYQREGCCGTCGYRGSGRAGALGCPVHTHLGHSLLPPREGSGGHDADGAGRVALAVQLTISHLDYAVCHLASITLCTELVLDIVVAERRLLDTGDGHRRLLLSPRAVPAFLQLNALLGLGSLVVAAGAHQGQGPGSARPAPLAGAQRPAARPPGPAPARVSTAAEPRPPGSPPRGLHFEPGPEAARDHGGPCARGSRGRGPGRAEGRELSARLPGGGSSGGRGSGIQTRVQHVHGGGGGEGRGGRGGGGRPGGPEPGAHAARQEGTEETREPLALITGTNSGVM